MASRIDNITSDISKLLEDGPQLGARTAERSLESLTRLEQELTQQQASLSARQSHIAAELRALAESGADSAAESEQLTQQDHQLRAKLGQLAAQLEKINELKQGLSESQSSRRDETEDDAVTVEVPDGDALRRAMALLRKRQRERENLQEELDSKLKLNSELGETDSIYGEQVKAARTLREALRSKDKTLIKEAQEKLLTLVAAEQKLMSDRGADPKDYTVVEEMFTSVSELDNYIASRKELATTGTGESRDNRTEIFELEQDIAQISQSIKSLLARIRKLRRSSTISSTQSSEQQAATSQTYNAQGSLVKNDSSTSSTSGVL